MLSQIVTERDEATLLMLQAFWLPDLPILGFFGTKRGIGPSMHVIGALSR